MSFSLPATIQLPSSPPRHDLAIAEVAIFGAILPIQLYIRYEQIRLHGEAKIAKNPTRCALRAWLNFVALFLQIRIIGFALYLGIQDPSRSTVIAEVVMQSAGASPLLLELSFVLIRCGRVDSCDNKISAYPEVVERLLRHVRFPMILAVVLIIVAAFILNLSVLKAGATVLFVTYVYVALVTVVILLRYRQMLVKNAQYGLWIAVATLPLYTVRFIYLMLVEFGDMKYDPIIGDWRYLVGLGFAMEVGIVILLVVAGVVIEPLRSAKISGRVLPMA